MAIHRSSQSWQMIPTFERREQTPPGMVLGDTGHDAGEIRVALFRQLHARKWIVFVRIESGGDNDEFWFECISRRH